MSDRWNKLTQRLAPARLFKRLALPALGLTVLACASNPQAVRYPGQPIYATQNPHVNPYAPPGLYGPPPPRVVIAAPPVAEPAPAAPVSANPGAVAAAPVPNQAPPPSGFSPQASPLLAAFESSPHGQKPTIDPYVLEVQQAAAARQYGWSSSWSRPYYGYGSGPYYGGYGSYSPYYGRTYGYGYGYPGAYGYGYGLGLGLGWGTGYGYYGRGWGGGYGGYGGHYGHHSYYGGGGGGGGGGFGGGHHGGGFGGGGGHHGGHR